MIPIDGEMLIAEVQKYPCIYDAKDEGYNDKPIRNEAWRQVAQSIVGENYNELPNDERKRIGVLIQKKWKALKDAFRRATIDKNGKVVTQRKKYVHFKQMSFLVQTYTNRSKLAKKKREEDEEEEEEEEELLEQPIKHKPPTRVIAPQVASRKRKRSIDDSDQQLMETKDMKHTDTADRMFLLSLLPDLQSLQPQQKIEFKIKIMRLLQDLQFSRTR